MNELRFHDPANVTTGLTTVYAVLTHKVDGTYVNASTGAALAASAANWPTAAIELTDAVTYLYRGSVPSGTAAGEYTVEVCLKAGGSYAISDAKKGQGDLIWNGTAEIEAAEAVGDELDGQAVTRTAPVDVDDDNRLTLYQGTDHQTGSYLPSWTITGYTGPALGASGKLRLLNKDAYDKHGSSAAAELEVTASVSQVSTTLTITAAITAAQSLAIGTTYPPADQDSHQYQLVGITSSGALEVLLINSPATVHRQIGAP